MSNTVQYRGYYGSNDANTGRDPSPNLWADFPWDAIVSGSKKGVVFHDDFLDFGLPGTQTTQINLGRYKVYNTGSGVVATDSFPNGTAATPGGFISMLTDTAGDQSVIGTHACPFSLKAGSGKLVFEARVATTTIATAATHKFIGLGNNSDVTFGAAIPLADADATGTAVALLGWTRLEDGLGVLNTSYTDEAATYTHVQTSAGAIAANTFVKLGLIFDPNAPAASRVKFYINGVPTSTPMSNTTLTGLTHLDNSNLGLVFAQFADSSGTADYGYLDWWRCAQLHE